MTYKSLSGFFLLSGLCVLGTSNALAEQECFVKPRVGAVRVTDAETGAPVATLMSGDPVYSIWHGRGIGSDAFIVDGTAFRRVSGISREFLDCDDSSRSTQFPIVFEGLEGRVKLFEEFGIVMDPIFIDPERKRLPEQPHKCFSIGEGHTSPEIAESTFANYRNQSFNLDNLCMALTSGQIKFHPETGERLPTYVIADGDGYYTTISDEYLFFVPQCFSQGKFASEGTYAMMTPLGCTINYHPWSGRRLNTREVDLFTRSSFLLVSGEAGAVETDSEALADDPNRRATSARIEAIKNQATSN